MDTKIAISIVTNRYIKPQTVKSLSDLLLETTNDVTVIIATQGYTIAENRTYAVIQAKKQNCTHILFIDDDMEFPANTLDTLLAHKKEIVGVNSQSRTLPLSTTVALLKDGEYWPHDQVPGYYQMPEELFECYSVGMGVALIDMKVFDEIDLPWFHFETHENGKVMVGEDAWLCKQMRDKGMKIWCDPSIEIGHIGEYNYALYNQTEDTFNDVKM